MENDANELMLGKITRLSNEIVIYYPNLTDYESLKLAIEIEKIDKLDNIYIGLNEIIESIDSISSDDSMIAHNLHEVERSLDFLAETIKNKD
jgi:hypothetical protein